MLKTRIGTYLKTQTGDESFSAYLPKDLPPIPPIDLTKVDDLHAEATYLLGKLDGFHEVIPDSGLFIYMYVRKEAVLSSQIEGTQSSMVAFLDAEDAPNAQHLPGVTLADIRDVSNYIKAQDYALDRMQTLPLSLRLIREVHGVLLNNGRGSQFMPGQFRRSQNWIGGTRPGNAHYVPPPVDYMHRSLDNLEQFLHQTHYPTLIKAAMAHLQFESIHPFLDGNGRIGRLLITLLICREGLLARPLIYPSLYLKQNRRSYYDLLTHVRQTGQWEVWIAFFLNGVIASAKDAIQTARDISNVFREDQAHIESLHQGKQKAVSVLFKALQRRGIISLRQAAKQTGLNYTPASRGLKTLEQLKIVTEVTGNKRNRRYAYTRFVNILAKDTDPLPK